MLILPSSNISYLVGASKHKQIVETDGRLGLSLPHIKVPCYPPHIAIPLLGELLPVLPQPLYGPGF